MLKRVESAATRLITIDGEDYPIVSYVGTTTRELGEVFSDNYTQAVPVRWSAGTALPTKSSSVTLDTISRRIESVDDRVAIAGYIVLNLVRR